MPSKPPSNFSALQIRLKRIVRHALWPYPSRYFPFGLLRGHGNLFGKNVDLHISGYPRCGNTFARTAFVFGNPNVRIQSHRHIPTYVLHLVKHKIPGLTLIRRPMDAAVSWAIHERQSLEDAIAYWNDYYETLLPVRSELFLAEFTDMTRDFGSVMKAFNQRWGTSYALFEHTPENAARCFRATEEENRKPNGEIQEMRVCRPSPQRRKVKDAYLEDLDQSPFLQDELARAEELYAVFVSPPSRSGKGATVRLVPGRPQNENRVSSVEASAA